MLEILDQVKKEHLLKELLTIDLRCQMMTLNSLWKTQVTTKWLTCDTSIIFYCFFFPDSKISVSNIFVGDAIFSEDTPRDSCQNIHQSGLGKCHTKQEQCCQLLKMFSAKIIPVWSYRRHWLIVSSWSNFDQ